VKSDIIIPIYRYMKDTSTDKTSFSIKKELMKELNEYCEKNDINRSKLISRLINNHLRTIREETEVLKIKN